MRNWNNQRGNNYRNSSSQDDYRERSRQKNRDRNWSENRNRNYSRDNQNYSRDNYRNNRNNRNRQWDKEKIRKVHKVIVEDPSQFIISDCPELDKLTIKKFVPKIEVSETVPEPLSVKKDSRVDQLKDKITPVEKIWGSHVKQYLNDSQFVEIYRKGRSLAYGEIEYGKTMIKYDEGDKSMYYQNETAQSKIFSRAYFKIWEILAMGVFEGKQAEKLTIASVAQGPGGFIHALIDFRQKHAKDVTDQFYGITLKIDNNTRNAKDWSDQRGKAFFSSMRNIGYQIKLSYGVTETGDLLKKENIDYFADKDLQGKKCYLVTGDGGIECIGDKQFDYQEVFNVKLFLGEIITALRVQEIGGKFILKVYDSSFALTRQLMILLSTFYKKVRMIKPVTSRPGNSQKYMLCQNFIGMSNQEFQELKQLLTQWCKIQPDLSYFQNSKYVTNILDFPQLPNKEQIWQNLEKCNYHFLEEQAQKLEEGLKLIEENEGDSEQIMRLLKKRRFEEQMSYAYEWCRRYGLKAIDVMVGEQEKQQ